MSAARLAAAAVGGGDLGVGRLAAGLQRTNLSQFNPRHDLAHDGRWGNVVTVNGTRGTTLAVKAGERIRLRLVNVAPRLRSRLCRS